MRLVVVYAGEAVVYAGRGCACGVRRLCMRGLVVYAVGGGRLPFQSTIAMSIAIPLRIKFCLVDLLQRPLQVSWRKAVPKLWLQRQCQGPTQIARSRT